jgi:hypothetical protein
MPSTSYRAEIELLENGATGNGFIDNKKIEQYIAEASSPTDVDASIAKERANSRFLLLVTKLQYMANIYISNVVVTGADANTPPDVFAFTMTVEHGDGVLDTADEENEGERLTGMDCLKRWIARSLITTENSDIREYYDPTVSSSLGVNGVATANAVRYGSTIGAIEVGKLANTITAAETAITITSLD